MLMLGEQEDQSSLIQKYKIPSVTFIYQYQQPLVVLYISVLCSWIIHSAIHAEASHPPHTSRQNPDWIHRLTGLNLTNMSENKLFSLFLFWKPLLLELMSTGQAFYIIGNGDRPRKLQSVHPSYRLQKRVIYSGHVTSRGSLSNTNRLLTLTCMWLEQKDTKICLQSFTDTKTGWRGDVRVCLHSSLRCRWELQVVSRLDLKICWIYSQLGS